MKIGVFLLILNIACLNVIAQQSDFRFDENSKLYIDNSTNTLCNKKYELWDSLTNETYEYYMLNGRLESTVHTHFPSKLRYIRSIDLNTGVEKISSFDSLNRQLYFKVSGWGNFSEVEFDSENGMPIFYCTRYNDNVSLEYLDEKGKIFKSYTFKLNKNVKYTYEGWSGFVGGTFKTKYKSIKFIKDKSKISLIKERDFLEMGLFQVGPRYEYVDDYENKKKQLQYIYYYKNGVSIKRELYKDGKVIKVEKYE